jgi:D-alanine transaminase
VFVKPLSNNDPNKKSGVKVTLEKDLRWQRFDIKSTSLLPTVLVNHKAIKSGAYEAVLHRDNNITEGSHTNFFAIKNKTVFTAPLSNYILDGVTRKVVLEICKENGINFLEDYINVNQLKTFDEFFITGTTTEITPVVQINDWTVNKGNPGKVTKLIQDLFFNYTQNDN